MRGFFIQGLSGVCNGGDDEVILGLLQGLDRE